MSFFISPKEINEIVKGQTISLIEVGPECAIVHTESGLRIEVSANQFVDGDTVIQDDGFQVEISKDGKHIARHGR